MSEYNADDRHYTPPTRGSIVLSGVVVQYHVNDPAGLHDPRKTHAVPIEVTVETSTKVGNHVVSYAFRNGECVAMRNGKRYDASHPRFLHGPYLEGMQVARHNLRSALEAAEQRRAPGNVQAILRRGLGDTIDEVAA